MLSSLSASARGPWCVRRSVPAARHGPVNDVSDAQVSESARRPVTHQDGRVARHAIGAGMEASPVRVDAPGESDVGAVVVREDLARVVLIDFEARRRGLFEVLDLGGGPRVGRVGDRLQHAWIYCTERAFRSNPGTAKTPAVE